MSIESTLQQHRALIQLALAKAAAANAAAAATQLVFPTTGADFAAVAAACRAAQSHGPRIIFCPAATVIPAGAYDFGDNVTWLGAIAANPGGTGTPVTISAGATFATSPIRFQNMNLVSHGPVGADVGLFRFVNVPAAVVQFVDALWDGSVSSGNLFSADASSFVVFRLSGFSGTFTGGAGCFFGDTVGGTLEAQCATGTPAAELLPQVDTSIFQGDGAAALVLAFLDAGARISATQAQFLGTITVEDLVLRGTQLDTSKPGALLVGAINASSVELGNASATMSTYGASPVSQHTAQGSTAGFVAGAGTPVTSTSTWVGGVGARTYTIGDVIDALKHFGIMAP